MKLVCICGAEMKQNGEVVKKSIAQTLFKCSCGNTGLILNYMGSETLPDFFIKDPTGKLVRNGQIQE